MVFVQRQPVQQRRLQAGLARRFHVLGVGGQQLRLLAQDGVSHRQQRAVLLRGIGAGQLAAGLAGGLARLLHIVFDVHRGNFQSQNRELTLRVNQSGKGSQHGAHGAGERADARE